MHIYIQDFGQHSMEFVDVVNDDMSRRFVLRPFENSHVRDVAEGNGKLFCLASSNYDGDRKLYSTQLAVFDSSTGEESKRTVLPFQAYTVAYLARNDLLAIQFMDREISFLDAETLEIVWETNPLFSPELIKKWRFGLRAVAQSYREISPETRPYPPGCVYVGKRLFEDIDGRIWGIASSDWGDRKTHEIHGISAGVFSFDVAKHKHSFHPVEFSPWGAPLLMFPSPDGRKVVRQSPERKLGTPFDAGHDPSKFTWMIEHKNLDLWSVQNQEPIIRLHVSDTPVSVYIGGHGSGSDSHLRRLADWSRKTKDPFRMPLKNPPGIKNLNAGYEALRDLHDLLKDQRIAVHWEEDSGAIWVATQFSLRRITVEGKRGPLLVLDRFLNDEHRAILNRRPAGTDIGAREAYPAVRMPIIKTIRTNATDVEVGFQSTVICFPRKVALSDEPMVLLTDDMISVACAPKLTAKDIAAQIPGLIRIKSWNKNDVAAGLRGLADTLRRDIFSLMTNGITLVFQVQSSFLEERRFVEKLREKDIDIVNDAKAVIDAWCAALRQHNLLFSGNNEGAAPLSYVLEYIAEHDTECSEQLREYCLLRDGEHESYSRDTVLKSYVDRLGLTKPGLWRLGILYCLLFRRDGRSVFNEGQQISDWLHTGILIEAQATLLPKEFGRYVLSELSEFQTQPDVFAAFGTHKEAAANAKQDLLDQLKDTAWDKDCRAILLGESISGQSE